MSRILVTTFTNMPDLALDNFRQGFVDALCRQGNQVLVLRTNDFLKSYQDSNELSSEIDAQKLLKAIKQFAPDAAVSMNHSGMIAGLAESLECPTGIWLLDGPAYLIDPDECRKRRGQYQMFIPVQAMRNDLRAGFGFDDRHIHYLPFASDFESRQESVEHNISFIGTFFVSSRLQEVLRENSQSPLVRERIGRLIDSYNADADRLFQDRLRDFSLEKVFTGKWDDAAIQNTLAINRRIKVLDAVQDLGLTLYGTTDWPSAMPFSFGLALSYNPTLLTSKADLQAIYNSSKINLNVSHFQARGGLPWRVFDVMACNGVLVSDKQKDLSVLFGQEVDVPTYESPADARDVCLSLLADEQRRIELASASKRAMDKGHRFRHRLADMAEVFGVSLTGDREGSIEFLDAGNFTLPMKMVKGAETLSTRSHEPAERPAIKKTFLQKLDSAVNDRLLTADLDGALKLLVDFVQEQSQDFNVVTRIYGSALLDNLCRRIGEISLSQMRGTEAIDAHNRYQQRTVYVVTEVSTVGGHGRVLVDLIRSRPGNEAIILVTDLLSRCSENEVKSLLSTVPAEVRFARAHHSLNERLRWLQQELISLKPEQVFLFNHPFDAVAVAACTQAGAAGEVHFYHHCDHAFTLGLYGQWTNHIDFRPAGFENCRHALGIEHNVYLPLTLTGHQESVRETFIESGKLTSATAGSYKFDLPYTFKLQDIVPLILEKTGGRHVHVGKLSDHILYELMDNLDKLQIDKSNFVYQLQCDDLRRTLCDLQVDLYIDSFALAGCRSVIEAMSANIPIAVHHNYRSRLFSSKDVAPNAFSWSEPNELFDYVETLDQTLLSQWSLVSQQQFEGQHHPNVFTEKLEAILAGRSLDIPDPLPTYAIDEFQSMRDIPSNAPANGENIKFDDPLPLEIELRSLLSSTSWKCTRPLREIKRLLTAEKAQPEAQTGITTSTDEDYCSYLRSTIYRVRSSFSWRCSEPLRIVGAYTARPTAKLDRGNE